MSISVDEGAYHAVMLYIGTHMLCAGGTASQVLGMQKVRFAALGVETAC
jgi:hypothetical protein